MPSAPKSTRAQSTPATSKPSAPSRAAPPARGAAQRRPHPSRPIKEAVLYARVSSKDQEREGFSIPAQQALLRAYAQEHGLAVLQEFVDVETAKKAGRTHFSEMLTFLKKHSTCKIILVEKTDRLYRNLKDWVTLDEMNLEIHLVKEGAVLSEDSRSSEKFIHGIKVLMAKNYIDNLCEETRKGMIEKARQGIWPSKAPLGYRNVQRADGKNIIEVDPEVGPQIRRMFEWYASGEYSLQTLTQKMRKEGMRFRRSSQPIPRTTIHIILQNPLYIGEFDWDGVRYPGIHEPLVSRELFTRVQDLLKGRATNCRRVQKRDFAFSGLVSCASCAAEGESRLLIGSLIKKQYHYYHCERCKQLGQAKYYREEVIDAEVVRSLQSLSLDAEVMEWLKLALRASLSDEKVHHGEAIGRLQAQSDKLQRRIDAAYEDRLDGRIDAAFFDRKAKEWREEQGRILREIAAHQAADQGYMEAGISLLELAQKAVVLYQSQDGPEKRRLLRFIYLNSLWDGERLTISWRQPFGFLAESMEESQSESTPGEVSGGRFDKWLRKTVQTRTQGGPDSPLSVSIIRAVISRRSSSHREKKRDQVAGPGVLGRALEYQAKLGTDGIKTRADLARHLGVSRAWVTQVLAVLDVPGPLMDTLCRAEAAGRPITEGTWRRVKGLVAGEAVEQLREWGYA